MSLGEFIKNAAILGMGRAQTDRRYPQLPVPNIGNRIIGGRMGTMSNTTLKTFHVTAEMVQAFDAIAPIFANTDSTFSVSITAVKMSVLASAADLNNSGGAWTAALNVSGITNMHAPVAPRNGANCVSYFSPDPIPLSSIPRTDGGSGFLVACRVYSQQSYAALPVWGNGIQDMTPWATKTTGGLWCARQQNGDAVTVPANFTSTTDVSQSPVVGFRYFARGKVIAVTGVGDSIAEGQGTYIGESHASLAARQLSSAAGIALEYANCGWSGQSMKGTNGFGSRAMDILESAVRPDVMVFPSGSPNDIATTISQSDIDTFKYWRSLVAGACARRGVPLIFTTWIPTNTAVKNYGSTDALRVADNAALLALSGKGFYVADTSTPMSGVTASGQVQMLAGSTNDDIHPNDTGIALMTAPLAPILKRICGV